MTTAPPDRLLSAEELAHLPDDGYRYELVRGRLVRMPPNFTSSSMVATTIAIIVGAFVRLHKLGVCSGVDGGVQTERDPDTVRAPDFAFFRKDRLPPSGVPRRGYLHTPDLAVEVMSPSDRFARLVAKAEEYVAAGTTLVWLVLPDERAVLVYRRGRPTRTLDGDALLDGEDVLPGFTLALPDLWEGLAENE